MGVFLLLIGLAQMFFGNPVFWYFYLAGLLALVSGIFLPIAIKPVFIMFSYIGFYMGKVNSIILLTVFFYLFIAPIGFLLRFIGKDVLNLNVKKEVKSYWVKREKNDFGKEDFENQF